MNLNTPLIYFFLFSSSATQHGLYSARQVQTETSTRHLPLHVGCPPTYTLLTNTMNQETALTKNVLVLALTALSPQY